MNKRFSSGLIQLFFITGTVLVGTVVFAQSNETFKYCGTADGKDNAACPSCFGTCKLPKTRYKVCEKKGDDCTMPKRKNAKCDGELFDGGADGKKCDGLKVGACQYTYKTCEEEEGPEE